MAAAYHGFPSSSFSQLVLWQTCLRSIAWWGLPVVAELERYRFLQNIPWNQLLYPCICCWSFQSLQLYFSPDCLYTMSPASVSPVPLTLCPTVLFSSHLIYIQVLLAILLSWSMCAILTVTNVFSEDNKARTDLYDHLITDTPWFRVPYPGKVVYYCQSEEKRTHTHTERDRHLGQR